MWTYTKSNELYHYGVKGQKWGVRRYQNKDGSLTPAGKKRMKIVSDAADRASAYAKYSNEVVTNLKTRGSMSTSGPKFKDKKELDAHISGYTQLGKRYMAMHAKFSNKKISDIDRKTLNSAKHFLKNSKYFNDYNLFSDYNWHKTYGDPEKYIRDTVNFEVQDTKVRFGR